MTEIIFPRLERVAVPVPPGLSARFEAFIRDKGWTREEGVKILLAYGADYLTFEELTPEQLYNEWAAARAELSALRHRAYIADEAIRNLRLNITGLEASNSQFQRSFPQQRARRERLLHMLAERERQAPGMSVVGPDADGDRSKRGVR